MDFKLEHLNRYLCEDIDDETEEDTEMDDSPEEEKEEVKEIHTDFEMSPDAEEVGYDITNFNKPCCHVEFKNDTNEEVEDFDIAQAKPQDYTVYVSDTADAECCKLFQAKLNRLGFENIIDMDADKFINDEPSSVEEE